MSDKMDEKGFLFTTDAVLALVVVIVLTASIVTYGLLPIYQGQNHQHLEALADSALETMEQDGTLRYAAVQYANNNSSGAQQTLQTELNMLIPNSVGYKITMDPYGSVSNSNGILTSTDVATKVKVISAPSEGWMGRAYYKQDEVEFQDITGSSVTTVWNFHNYLKNFSPWNGGLNTYKYWGGSNSNPQTSIGINFTIPGPVNGAKFLLGSASGTGTGNNKAFPADVLVNGQHNYIKNSSFTPLYVSSGQGIIFNYPQNISTTSLFGNTNNNFYVNFNASSSMNMPWFSIIANYTTTINAPKGIANVTIPFTDIAGIGQPQGSTSVIYNLNTGATSNTPGRTIDWVNDGSKDFDTSTPFALTSIPSVGVGSAVATVQDIDLPAGNRLFDAFTVVNAFGGEDGAIVQVKTANATTWTTIFSSFTNTARSDGGYGNVPGIINIQPYLAVGKNKVRIITWDNVPGNDYDLVGLSSCYSKITYSKFPIRWDTFPFNNYQNSSSSKTTTETQAQNFRVDTDAQSALLFIGVGGDSRNITVTVKNSTGSTATLWPANKPIPYVIKLADEDTTRVMSTVLANGTAVPKPGNYTITVSVIPSLAYESGDGGSNTPQYGYSANPEIFSGTRVSVIYPKFLENVWAVGFADNPNQAALNAISSLKDSLHDAGYTVDPTLIRNNTLYTGDVPNSIPVRLDLYQQ